MMRSAFAAQYAATLVARAATDPDYEYAARDADRTAERMIAALASGRGDVHGSPVLRSLARTLGIPHTHDGWRAFASTLEDDR